VEDLAPSFSISQIAELLRGEIIGDRDACIAPVKIHLTDSSQSVIVGRSLFVAVSGSAFDGHRFVANACEAGALACVVEKECQAPAGAILIRVRDSRVALSRLAALVCDKPAEKLRMIGITGTNGKSSVQWILHSLLNVSGIETARIGTIGRQIKSQVKGSALTTPGALELHEFLSDCVIASVDTCVMEVSSHALEQHRVEDVEFDVAVFTNLSRDHLDYHDSFESYFQAKSHLFDLLSVGGTAVIWDDSEYGRALLGKTRSLGKQALLCGTASDCDIRVADTRFSIARTSVELRCTQCAK
jgi:UDP-N-acetylmuramoyl-L-alanyl-D-glutamate--2,6-diaminopimelate ligase